VYFSDSHMFANAARFERDMNEVGEGEK